MLEWVVRFVVIARLERLTIYNLSFCNRAMESIYIDIVNVSDIYTRILSNTACYYINIYSSPNNYLNKYCRYGHVTMICLHVIE